MTKKVILWVITLSAGIIVSYSLIRLTFPSVLSEYDLRNIFFARFLPQYSNQERQVIYEDLIDVIEKYSGMYSFYAKNIYTGRTYSYNENQYFYAASLYKIPLAVATFKKIELGEISKQDKFAYTHADFTGGTGIIYTYPYGTELEVDYILDRLLKDSDNIAQNMLTRTLGSSMIKEAFSIHGETTSYYHTNESNPIEISLYLETLLKSSYLEKTSVYDMLGKMSHTSFDDRVSKGLSQDLIFAHKIGNWGDTGSWHDCGVVMKDYQKVVVCLMSKNTTFDDFLFVSEKFGNFVNYLF